MTKRQISLAWAGLSLLILFAFIGCSLWQVYLWGLHAADDGYFAVVAKNLATGWGYATTVPFASGKWTTVTFDVYTTTGPVLILPTALFIKLFGNKYWVPGFSTVVCWSLMLIVLGLLLRTYTTGPGLPLAALVFLFLNYVSQSYYAWYTMLGEIPTALLITLAVFLFFHSEAPPYRLLSGASFGLAMLAKPLAVGAIPGFLLAVSGIHLIRNWHNPTRATWLGLIRSLAYLGLGIIVPLALFETWKLLALGPATYLARWVEYREVTMQYGVSSQAPANLLKLYTDRLGVLQDSYVFWLPGALPLLALALFMTRKDDKLLEVFVVFASIIAVYTVWWLFFSIGWPRYYLITVVLIYVAIALPFLQRNFPVRRWLPYLLIIAAWSSPFWPRLPYLLYQLGNRNGPGRENTQALQEVSQELERDIAHKEVIVTQAWMTSADMEYIMDSHANFTHYTDREAIGANPFLIVINTTWEAKDDTYFAGMLQNCRQRQEIGPYLIAHCPPLATQ